MRSKETKSQRRGEAKKHRIKETETQENAKSAFVLFSASMRLCIYTSMFLCLLASGFSSGCVRVAGTAGYSKINPDGETTAKQARFDTADYIPSNSTPGKITI